MEISVKELEEKINRGEKVMVDFWAGFCGPCRIMKPNFEKVSEELRNKNSDIQLYTMSLDIEDNRNYAIKLGVMGIPAIRAFNNGKEVLSKVGLMSEQEITKLTNQAFI